MKLKTRVGIYPGSPIARLRPMQIGTRPALPVDMQQLALSVEQVALLDEAAPKLADVDSLMVMPLTEAKRLAAAEFERSYLIRVMERAGGSVSEAARLAATAPTSGACSSGTGCGLR